jgi:hypothetical protein
MNENLTPEEKKIAAMRTITQSLERAFIAAETCVSSIQYLEDSDIVRIHHTDGFSACISGEGKNALALLHEIFYELKPFLINSFNKGKSWNKSFGPSASFSLERLLK